MASPLPVIAVTGLFVTLDNRPAEGYVTLTPVSPRTVGDGWIIIGATTVGYVRGGQLNTSIIADSDALTSDLYVRVVEHLDDAPTESYIVQPQGTILDLATVPRVTVVPPGQAYVPATALGQPNGVATLGPDGILTASQRPPGGGGVTDHGALTGLSDDDHLQYLTAGRGDARYYTQTAINTSLAGKENTGVAAASMTAHLAAADPHPQYLDTAELLAALTGYTPTSRQVATGTGLSGGGTLAVDRTLTLSAGAQTSLAKADTAVQPGTLAAVATSGAYSDLTGKPSIPDSYDDLTGTVPTSALPALAIGEVFTVGSQAAMLALAAQRGDIAIRTDLSATFILASDSPGTLADWKQLATPADAVLSVNGQTGVVVLAKADIGLGNVSNLAPANLPVSTATQTALDGKQAADGDLTAIAALSPADGALLQRVAGAWTDRTPAQVKTSLTLTKTDVGLGNVDNTADTAKPVSTAQQAALDTKVDEATLTTKGDLFIATAAGVLARLPVGTDDQVLTADSAQTAGVRWADASGGGAGAALDQTAVRYGCKALTLDPHDLSWTTPQYIEMVVGRLYQFWVPLPVGELVTGVRLPIQLQAPGGGVLHFGVFQDDNTQLGETGNVAAQFQDAGIAGTWVDTPLTAPAVTTGPGIWIVGLTTIAGGPKLAFCNTSGSADLPGWLLNPASHKTAVRTEGVAAFPSTLAPGAGIDYIDAIMGVY